MSRSKCHQETRDSDSSLPDRVTLIGATFALLCRRPRKTSRRQEVARLWRNTTFRSPFVGGTIQRISFLCLTLALTWTSPVPAMLTTTLDPGPIGSTFADKSFDVTRSLSDLPADGSPITIDFVIPSPLTLAFDLEEGAGRRQIFGLRFDILWTDNISDRTKPSRGSASLIDVEGQVRPSAHVDVRSVATLTNVETGWLWASNPAPVQFNKLQMSFSLPEPEPELPDLVPGPPQVDSAALRLFIVGPPDGEIAVETIPEPATIVVWLFLGTIASVSYSRWR